MLAATTLSKKCHWQSPPVKVAVGQEIRNCEVMVLSWHVQKSLLGVQGGSQQFISWECQVVLHGTTVLQEGLLSSLYLLCVVACSCSSIRSFFKVQMATKEHCPQKHWWGRGRGRERGEGRGSEREREPIVQDQVASSQATNKVKSTGSPSGVPSVSPELLLVGTQYPANLGLLNIQKLLYSRTSLAKLTANPVTSKLNDATSHKG